MHKTAINPWDWSLQFGYAQAQLVENSNRQLVISGQTAVDENGAPQHEGDMRTQIALTMDNLKAVLKAADMGFENISRLKIYTLDVDEAMKHFDILGQHLGPANNMPAMTLLGVTRLALPTLMVEIEALAHD